MHIVIFITVGGREEGLMISRALVEERLAACVSMIEGVSSIYRWEGKVDEAKECLLIVKTVGELMYRVIERVKSLHSYKTPEIIAVEVKGGLGSYLDWIASSVDSGRR